MWGHAHAQTHACLPPAHLRTRTNASTRTRTPTHTHTHARTLTDARAARQAAAKEELEIATAALGLARAEAAQAPNPNPLTATDSSPTRARPLNDGGLDAVLCLRRPAGVRPPRRRPRGLSRKKSERPFRPPARPARVQALALALRHCDVRRSALDATTRAHAAQRAVTSHGWESAAGGEQRRRRRRVRASGGRDGVRRPRPAGPETRCLQWMEATVATAATVAIIYFITHL